MLLTCVRSRHYYYHIRAWIKTHSVLENQILILRYIFLWLLWWSFYSLNALNRLVILLYILVKYSSNFLFETFKMLLSSTITWLVLRVLIHIIWLHALCHFITIIARAFSFFINASFLIRSLHNIATLGTNSVIKSFLSLWATYALF